MRFGLPVRKSKGIFSTNFNLQSDWQLDNVLGVDFKHLGEFHCEDMQEILKLTLWINSLTFLKNKWLDNMLLFFKVLYIVHISILSVYVSDFSNHHTSSELHDYKCNKYSMHCYSNCSVILL